MATITTRPDVDPIDEQESDVTAWNAWDTVDLRSFRDFLDTAPDAADPWEDDPGIVKLVQECDRATAKQRAQRAHHRADREAGR